MATGSDTTRHFYDALGNLVRVETPTDTVAYRVDGLNRRVERKVNGMVTNRWVWEGGLRIAAEVDSTGGILKRYVYGTRVNVPEYVVAGDSVYIVITDHLGSMRLVANAVTGAIVERVEYDAWGVESGATRTGLVPMGFAGGLVDSLAGLVRFGMRDYAPCDARWTAVDPARFNGGDANLHRYVIGDPINGTDRNGLYIDDLIEANARVIEIYGTAAATRSQGQQLFPHSDAERHRYASETLAEAHGEVVARSMGIFNEMQGFILWDLPRLGPTIRGQREWAFEIEDLIHNEEGISRWKAKRQLKKKHTKQDCTNQRLGRRR